MGNGTEPDGTTPSLRVSDAERQAVVDLLRDQTTAGRLTLGEFEERLDEVYRARTDVELREPLRELPVEPPPVAGRAGSPAQGSLDEITPADLRQRWRLRVRKETAEFLTPNFVCNLIWIMGDGGYWWPGWVLLGTGVGLIGTVAKGFDPEKERAALLAQRRKQAIADIEARQSRAPHQP